MDGADRELLALLQAIPIIWSLKEADTGRLLYVSDQSREFFSPADLTPGATVATLFPSDTARVLDEADRKVASTGQMTSLPVWMPDARGGRRHLAIVKFPVQAARGRLIGTVGLDISQFKSDAWDASTYRQILDAISDLVLVKGPSSNLLWGNRAFQEAHGMTNEQLEGLVGAPFEEPDIVHQYVQDDRTVFTTGRRVDIPDEPMMWVDGKTRSVHTVKSPIFGPDGAVKMLVAVIRDITDRKQLETDLSQAQKLESLGRLAAGMAHEINTPIQFIGDQRRFAAEAFEDLLGLIGKYQGLAAKVAAGTATVADTIAIRAAEEDVDLTYLKDGLSRSFEDMADGVTRVARLVQALKEFGHPDDGVQELTDVNAAIRRTLVVATNEYRYVADIVLDLVELPLTTCNVSELQQVILNLIVNASHAIADAGRAERGTIAISTRCDDEAITISVRDTGCGIPLAIQSRVFDPFFTTKSVGRGTGQGLSIARLIVDKHRGVLSFETAVGKGTTFLIRLPRA